MSSSCTSRKDPTDEVLPFEEVMQQDLMIAVGKWGQGDHGNAFPEADNGLRECLSAMMPPAAAPLSPTHVAAARRT